MKIIVNHNCEDFNGYRAARVKSLFNCESGANFEAEADLPIEDSSWKIGVIVGRSGTGKSSLGAKAFGEDKVYRPIWGDRPIIDEIAPSGDFNEATSALAAVGLGSVPSWLRPYSVLSTGERFRADLARIIVEAPSEAVIDEFSSVVDRQIAKIGALAFAKAWRRKATGRVILLTCHYDVLEWLNPDWVFNTGGAGLSYTKDSLCRPPIELEIRRGGWSLWRVFKPHHYLDLPNMIAATNYVGFVNNDPVVHLAVSTRQGLIEARACRLVVMPEWQGAGVGLRFLNFVCEEWRRGRNRYNLRLPTLFHTSHPGLCAALRRDKRWTQVSGKLYGGDKTKCAGSIARAALRKGGSLGVLTGYGGHFRAVQGFRYLGTEAAQ
jgi:GNAT superfamily N-acetyltransferase